ncbi:hypothetical protein Tco_1075878, partial [Tanacetum coccineum]
MVIYTFRDDPSTSAASDDVHSLLRFPMPEAFSDPLKILHSKILAQHDKETTEISHWSHPAHPLILNVEDSQGNNNMMPDINSGDPIKACEFQLCIFCATRSPLSLAHRYCKGHEIPLTYPPVDDHPEDFYCDICEEEMDPNFPLYHSVSGLDLVLEQVRDMESCTNKKKPLVLPWGRTPRLDSGVR